MVWMCLVFVWHGMSCRGWVTSPKFIMKTITSSIITAGLILGLAAFFSGCNQTTQTTSGQRYLDRYPVEPTMGKFQEVDREVREVAAVEPILEFPARLGLARIMNGRLTAIPSDEAENWLQLAENLGPSYGEFVPVSPLIAEMMTGSAGGNRGQHRVEDVVRQIRLGAARQHLDAVLIYEVHSTVDSRTLPTAIMNWTIIGAYVVPSEMADVVGYSQALLIDVRNGYPYGTATARAEKKQLSTYVSSPASNRNRADQARIVASLQLIPEVEKMMRNLRMELAETRLADSFSEQRN